MNKTIASCGHDISNNEWIQLSLMEFASDFNKGEVVRTVSYGIYCEACSSQYEKWGVVLHNKGEERNWLSGKKQYPVLA